MTPPRRPNDLNSQQIEEAYLRVARLEGLTLEQVEARLPPKIPPALRRKVLAELKAIMAGDDASDTDTSRIDRWGEAQQAALLLKQKVNSYLSHPFQKFDSAIYIQETALRENEKNREKYLKNFQAGGLRHPFIRALGRNFPLRFIDSLRGAKVFDQLAEEIAKRSPELIADRKLTVLYPASGSHLAPLFTAIRLIDENHLDEAEFILTDVNPVYTRRLDQQFLLLARNGVIDSYEVFSAQRFKEGGEERVYQLEYWGKKIKITLALNRSGEKFWRDEYAQGADLVIFHDTEGESGRLLKQLHPQSPQLVIMEGREKKTQKMGFPTSLPAREIKGQYGHCDASIPLKFPGIGIETGACFYESAQVVRLGN